MVQNLAFKGVWFRQGAIYLKPRAKLMIICLQIWYSLVHRPPRTSPDEIEPFKTERQQHANHQ